MARRSSRLKSSLPTKEPKRDVETDSGDEVAVKPPRKRQKAATPLEQDRQSGKSTTVAKKVRGRRGALKQLPEMPLDILYEQLEPLDLVQLTRTSKALRKILSEKSTLFIWRQARSNMDGIPECPDDLSEPAYATFLFETHCIGCQSSRHNILYCWELHARWCTKCIWEGDRFVRRNGYGVPDYNYDVYRLSPKIIIECGAKRNRRTQELIKNRLGALGWADEINNLPEKSRLEIHPLVRPQKELTDRNWQNIRPQLITFLEDEKQNRINQLELERFLMHRTTHQNQTYQQIIPPPAHLFIFEPFRRLILDTPISSDLTAKDFENIQEGLDTFFLEWKQEKDNELVRMVLGGPVSQTDLLNAETILTRATTAFNCKLCYKGSIHYPRILVHKHAMHPYAFGLDPRFPLHLRTAFDRLACGTFASVDLENAMIEYYRCYNKAASLVITTCGLDPAVASIKDMDNVDPIFQHHHGYPETKRNFVTWRAVIDKFVHHFRFPLTVVETCELADETMSRAIKHRRYEAFIEEKQFHESHYRDEDGTIKIRSFDVSYEHLLDEHEIENVTKEDVVRHIDDHEDCFEYSFPIDHFGFGSGSI
ncbi:hypothetical protein BDQ17DRAFT_1329561 [Cyathus striatus]|nr:hypothetical protein BDQ17DRAFT_1329561 [Cyathus striatus]